MLHKLWMPVVSRVCHFAFLVSLLAIPLLEDTQDSYYKFHNVTYNDTS